MHSIKRWEKVLVECHVFGKMKSLGILQPMLLRRIFSCCIHKQKISTYEVIIYSILTQKDHIKPYRVGFLKIVARTAKASMYGNRWEFENKLGINDNDTLHDLELCFQGETFYCYEFVITNAQTWDVQCRYVSIRKIQSRNQLVSCNIVMYGVSYGNIKTRKRIGNLLANFVCPAM